MKKKNTFLRMLITIFLAVLSVAAAATGVMAADNKEVVLLDDFNRADLGVAGNGGEYNAPNSAGIGIYWIQMNDNTKAVVENNALKITMNKDGWYGEGVAFKDPAYKYIIMKVKGEKGGEEKLLTLNPDAKGLKKFTELKGPDGKPLAPITTDYQNIVIDIQKSGFTLPNGFEAIHFNNTGALTVYIDEIYLSKTGIPVDLTQYLAAQNESESEASNAAEGSNAAVSSDSESSSNSNTSSSDVTTASASSNTLSDSNTLADTLDSSKVSGTANETAKKKPLLITIIILIMTLLIAAVIYNSFIRKLISKQRRSY